MPKQTPEAGTRAQQLTCLLRDALTGSASADQGVPYGRVVEVMG